MRVVLLDFSGDAGSLLPARLSESGFRLERAASLSEITRNGSANSAAAVLVDVGLNGPEGRMVVDPLRSAGITTPIVLVSAREDWREKVDSLDAGADDYIVKPVRSEEVAARLRATIRRFAGLSTDRIRLGKLDLDLKASCAWFDGKCLALTRNEFRLLRLLMLNPNQAIGHADIQSNLYPGIRERSINAVEVLVARLRRKIGRDVILTVRGSGYRFTTDIAPAPEDCGRELCRSGNTPQE